MEIKQVNTVSAYGQNLEVNAEHNWLAIIPSTVMGKTVSLIASFADKPLFVSKPGYNTWQPLNSKFETLKEIVVEAGFDYSTSLIDLSAQPEQRDIVVEIEDAFDEFIDALSDLKENIVHMEVGHIGHSLFCNEHGLLSKFGEKVHGLLVEQAQAQDVGNDESTPDVRVVRSAQELHEVLAEVLEKAFESKADKPKFS